MQLNRKTAVAAAIAGIIGTVVFDMVGVIAMGQWWDIPALLGEKIGGGLLTGVLFHYGNGILLAVIFAGLLPLFTGPVWLRAIQFITIQTIFGVWFFMFPLLGMGPLGLEMGTMMPVMALIRHWMYAIPVGILYPSLAEKLEPGVRLSGARA
jgi:hypothetical protein